VYSTCKRRSPCHYVTAPVSSSTTNGKQQNMSLYLTTPSFLCIFALGFQVAASSAIGMIWTVYMSLVSHR